MKFSVSDFISEEAKSVHFNGKCDDNSSKSIVSKYPGIGIRHLQSFLLALAVFSGYLQRVNLSVTIVAITNTNKTQNELSMDNERDSVVPMYSWDMETRGYILSAFFVGYLIMNFPASVVGVHINNKLLLTVTFFANGVISCLTPLIIEYKYRGSNQFLRHIAEMAGFGNWRVVVIIRVVQGLLQAFMLPTIHSIIARWAPPNERSTLVGFIMSGIPFGTAIILALSGVLSNTRVGWPSVFYVSGWIGILWAVIWSIFGANSPAESRTISVAEYTYICDRIPLKSTVEKEAVPWKSILTSWPVWALIVVHVGHNWGFWLLLSEMPTFIRWVLDFDIKSDGLLSAIPYLVMWIIQMPVLYTADYLNKKGITTISSSRKLWNTIGMWGSSAGLIILGYLDDNAKAAIMLYISTVTIGCCINAGSNINHIDLTPNYAGVLMGISNSLAATGGLGAPIVVGYIVHDIKSADQWRTVFVVGATIIFFSSLFFIVFGSGKTQSWNDKSADISE